ncbi:MAG: hypothetical protein AAFR61_30035 [Bacteroidota bacterium]
MNLPSRFSLFLYFGFLFLTFLACRETCEECRAQVNSRNYVNGTLVLETDTLYDPQTICGDQLDLFKDGPRYDTSSVNLNGTTTERADLTTYFCE